MLAEVKAIERNVRDVVHWGVWTGLTQFILDMMVSLPLVQVGLPPQPPAAPSRTTALKAGRTLCQHSVLEDQYWQRTGDKKRK